MDTQVAHDSYIEPRLLAFNNEGDWPDAGDWPLDLFVELTDPARIVIMQRPFGEDLSSVEEDTLMSMSTSEACGMDDIVAKMPGLLCEVSRIVIVTSQDQLEHWVKVFEKMAITENSANRATVTNVLALNKDRIVSAVSEFSPEAPVQALVDGQCVEVSGADLACAIEANTPGYMLYALLLPGHQLVDMVIDDMPGTALQPGDDICSVEVPTEFCVPISAEVCQPCPAVGQP